MSTDIVNRINRQKELEECEALLRKGIDTFVEVGQVLCRIRDKELYRVAGYSSFKLYIEERWEFSIRKAQLLMQDWRHAESRTEEIDAQKNAQLLTSKEKPLARIRDDSGSKSNGHTVDQEPPFHPPTREPGEDAAGIGQPAPLKDAIGQPVPDKLKDYFATDLYRDWSKQVETLRKDLKATGIWNPFYQGSLIEQHSKSLAEAIRMSQPHAVHAGCRGHGCVFCRQVGFVTESRMVEMQERNEWK